MSVTIMADKPASAAAVIDNLKWVLSETAVVTAKAQTYHWNVTGMAFGPLHALFQEIYEDHFVAQDDLAERIKALGGHADGRLEVALKSSTIKECDGAISATRMVENMARDQRTLSANLLELARTAEDEGDLGTQDMAIERSKVHDKFSWMLDAHLRD